MQSINPLKTTLNPSLENDSMKQTLKEDVKLFLYQLRELHELKCSSSLKMTSKIAREHLVEMFSSLTKKYSYELCSIANYSFVIAYGL
jgi:hypothetical protein